jgi:hypothetical protein
MVSTQKHFGYRIYQMVYVVRLQKRCLLVICSRDAINNFVLSPLKIYLKT